MVLEKKKRLTTNKKCELWHLKKSTLLFYSSVSFDHYVHLCHHHNQDPALLVPQKVPLYPSTVPQPLSDPILGSGSRQPLSAFHPYQ